jgi:hypothetical protein
VDARLSGMSSSTSTGSFASVMTSPLDRARERLFTASWTLWPGQQDRDLERHATDHTVTRKLDEFVLMWLRES